MPAAEVVIDPELVRGLLARQFPDLAELPLVPLAVGWDNELFRLGSDLVVRLPRRRSAVPLIEAEHRWLPGLAPRLPLPTPVPVRLGRPDARYPWPWSICSWLAGTTLAELVDQGGGLTDPDADAGALAGFLRALHEPAPADAPAGTIRGVPLRFRDATFHRYLHALDDEIDVDDVAARWRHATAAPDWDRPPVWIHGDLHAANVLTDGTRLSGIIDFGELASGDPATDLASAWTLLPPSARGTLRDAVGADDDTWRRAWGWALYFGVAIVASSADNPLFARLGRRALADVLADEGDGRIRD